MENDLLQKEEKIEGLKFTKKNKIQGREVLIKELRLQENNNEKKD